MRAVALVLPVLALVAVGPSQLASAHPSTPGPVPAVVADAPVPAGTLRIVVPETSTPHSDGLPETWGAGPHQLSVPVWRAINATPIGARLTVDGATCATAHLVPGTTTRLVCLAPATAAPQVVRVVVGPQVIGEWRHTT